jgi:AbrB family looped-hinge helix DNA binding protein
MADVGVIKEVDKLGRILIPKELRDRYGINEKIEIVSIRDGVLIKSPEYVLVKKHSNKKD